jgi:outer membrane protein OmpA-like peptidoglycan-associated protein
MLLIVNETKGMEFSGFIIWPNSKLYRDSRSKFNGIIKDDQIYIYETEQISGDPLLIGGTYHSNLEDCKKLAGFWNMPMVPEDCNTPEVTKNGGQYSLDQFNIPTIYFPHRKSDLSPKSEKELDELLRFMSTFKSVKINLSGYTDNTGSNAFNLLLSAERAQVVKDYLIKEGLEENRISTAHYGSMKPAEDNSTESGRILNRRTEITIRKK